MDYEYGIIDLTLGIAMGTAKSGVMNAHAGQDLTINESSSWLFACRLPYGAVARTYVR